MISATFNPETIESLQPFEAVILETPTLKDAELRERLISEMITKIETSCPAHLYESFEAAMKEIEMSRADTKTPFPGRDKFHWDYNQRMEATKRINLAVEGTSEVYLWYCTSCEELLNGHSRRVPFVEEYSLPFEYMVTKEGLASILNWTQKLNKVLAESPKLVMLLPELIAETRGNHKIEIENKLKLFVSQLYLHV